MHVLTQNGLYTFFSFFNLALCPPGFTSFDGLSPCTVVPIGYYWNNSKSAKPCPGGAKNFEAGSKGHNNM